MAVVVVVLPVAVAEHTGDSCGVVAEPFAAEGGDCMGLKVPQLEPGDIKYVLFVLSCVFICTRLLVLGRPQGTHNIEQCSLSFVI